MNIDLNGKNALVCGSSQGIGFAIAKELAAAGATLTLLARNENSLNNAVARLNGGSTKHNFIVADFDVEGAVQNAMNQISGTKYHIIVNNTGGPKPGKASEADENDYIIALKRHLINFQTIVKNILPSMKEEGYGRIINIISTSVKQPLPNLGVSNTVRGAVANWSKTLANELGEYGITVNNVLPGATNTERLTQIIKNKSNKMGMSESEVSESMKATIPIGRFADPQEIAWASLFLASPLASYITGTNMVVDGGRTSSL